MLKAIAADIRRAGCSLLILGGDLCGRAVPHRASPAERNLLLEFMGNAACGRAVVVRGNHDEPEDWEFLNSLPGITYVHESGQILKIGGRRIAVFPWMDRNAFGGEDWETALNHHWAEVFSGEAVDLIVAHAAYQGGAVSLGQPDLPTKDPIVSAEHQVKHGVRLALLGHYHSPHLAFDDGEHVALYGGASFINEFGESDERGWTEVDLTEGTFAHHPIPQAGRFVVEVDPASDTAAKIRPGQFGNPPDSCPEGTPISKAVKTLCDAGHHVRVQVTTANEAHAATIREGVARLREEHGSKVTAKITIDAPPAHREGAMEVASAVSLGDKIRAFAGSLRAPPKPRVVERAIEILQAGVDPLGGDHGDEED